PASDRHRPAPLPSDRRCRCRRACEVFPDAKAQTWHKPLPRAIAMLRRPRRVGRRGTMLAGLWREGSARLSSILSCSGLARDPARRDRSDGIDVLRALFALWVVLAHLIPWSATAQGPDA